MIYDAFSFFHELDLLEIRLNILDPYVDKFVIVESIETFMGEPKKLYFKENMLRYSKWLPKIIHYVVDDFPNDRELFELAQKSPCVGQGELNWIREFCQKESIKKALLGLNENDICYVSDLDEIWRPGLPIDFSRDKIYRLRQASYLYYLNNRTNGVDLWTGTIIAQYKTIRDNCLNHLLNRNMTPATIIEGAGWHYEAFGGLEGARAKVDLYRHVDTWTNDIRSNLEKRVTDNIDYKGRNITVWVDNSDLPEYIRNNLSFYSKFLKK
jgi:beta-1,4-mannosyl-glycoprotein beta-1,4-N-acetylglucosaminyltransferase